MPETTIRARWGQISLLFSAHFLSLVGNGLSAIAIPWFVFDLTGNAFVTAGVAVAGQLPNILVGLFSGPLIDRFSAKIVSVLCDGINALAVLMIPLLYSVGLLDVLALGLLVFLSQVIDVPGQTAKSVLIPALIDRERLPRERVNGMNSLLETAADLFTPSVSGLLIAMVGATTVLLLDAFSFLLAMVLIGGGLRRFQIDTDRAEERPSTKTVWLWMLRTGSLLRLAVYGMLINLVAVSLLSLSLTVIANSYDKQAVWLGIWLTCFACGTTLTTLAYTFAGHRFSALRLLQITPLGQAFGLGLAGLVFYMDLFASQPFLAGSLVSTALFIYGLNLGVGSVVDASVLQKTFLRINAAPFSLHFLH